MTGSSASCSVPGWSRKVSPCVPATTAPRPVAPFAEQTPDAVVLDVMLPDGSGLELLKQLRGDHPDLPALMLSARGEPLDRILGLELGADDYLAKPCDPRELTARLRAVLRRTPPGAAQRADATGRPVAELTRGVAQIDGQEISLTLPKAASSKRSCASPASRWTSRPWRNWRWAAS